ncbi:MAG: GNAT family N-acetyltransferase [Rhizobium sp.]
MIETPRLRQLRLSDASALFEFPGNPEAMQFTHVDASLKECRQRIAVHERQRRRCGYAPWTAVLKDNGRLIGWGGLYNDPVDPGWSVELGYYFHPDVWGHGYGRELVSAALKEEPMKS